MVKDYNIANRKTQVNIRQPLDKKTYFFVGIYAVNKEISKKQAVEELIILGWNAYKEKEGDFK